MREKKNLLRHDMANILRGILMGGADVIPGVSGGTVALIVGIYQRLVTAISHFDLKLLRHVRQCHWKSAAEHIDLRFLMTLGLGIGLGIIALGSVMNELLTGVRSRSLTLSAFAGMIVASSYLVARMIEIPSAGHGLFYCLLGATGASLAFMTASLPNANFAPNYLHIFISGMVAICAMILPGISGSYVLLLLGLYIHLTDILKSLLHGQISGESIATVFVFGMGCAIGLINFSKVLRWLLAGHQAPTMAVLCGFMLGALRKIWPFQQDMSPDQLEWKHKQFQNILPESFDGEVLSVIAVAIVALLLTITLDRLTGGHEKKLLQTKES